MSRYILAILIVGFTLLLLPDLAGGASASPTASELRQINKTSLPLLLDKAQDYYDIHPDSAVIYYTAIINRYSDSMQQEEKVICLKAALEMWELVFFHYFDYSSSFATLSKAKEISDAIDREKSRVDLYYGCMYNTLYEQSEDYGMGKKAFGYFSRAFDKALDEIDMMVCRMAFGNLVAVAGALGDLKEIKDKVARYRNIADEEQWEGREFDLGLYDAEILDASGRYEESALAYKNLIELARKPGLERYRYAALQGLIASLIHDRKFDEALSQIQSADTMIDADNLRDVRLMLYNMRTECYDSLRNYEMARRCKADYVMLKDSLLSFNQAAAVKSMEFMDDIREIDRQLTESRQKRQRQMFYLIAAIAILVFVGVAWWRLRLKTKALESANKSLYRKNQELLHLEADALRMKEAAAVGLNVGEDDHDRLRKYKVSPVDDDMRETLWNSVVDVLDHSPEIYDPDFSLERLADLCGSKAKYVSQVINERGGNFKTLINTRRIHKACRCMSESRNLTIEAIANNVGFRSANAFRSSFKRVTGLSPSQYIQMSKDQSIGCDTWWQD